MTATPTDTTRHRTHRGDLVILTAEQPLTDRQAHDLIDQIRKQKPRGIEVMVVDGGMRTHIARRARTPRHGYTPRWAR